jgi:hypothetical protein
MCLGTGRPGGEVKTPNIECGFDSKHFYFGDNVMKLHFLREEVGSKEQCLKPGRLG